MSVRASLRWALGVTTVMAVAALLLAPTVEQSPALAPKVTSAFKTHESRQPVAALGTVPAVREPMRMEAALVDLFAPPRPPEPQVAPAAPSHVAPVVQPPTVQPPPAPRPPPLPRFAGRMRTPEGKTLIFLRDGDQTLVAVPGVVLPSGYQVQGVTAAASAPAAVATLRLFHAATQHHEDLPLPVDND
jgi:hypothetical protein